MEQTYVFEGNETIQFTKYNVYTDTLRHGEAVVEKAIAVQQQLKATTFEDLLLEQKDYLDHFWSKSDVAIDGDTELARRHSL